MIIDHLSNIRRYQGIHSHFPQIFEYLKKANLSSFSLGKHDIIKEQAYVNINRELARNRQSAYLEAHKKQIDIQIIISGTDTMGWKPMAHCKKIQSAYDEEKDIIFYNENPELFVPVGPSFFVIFFPEDAHMPLLGSGEIHKAIVKVNIQSHAVKIGDPYEKY